MSEARPRIGVSACLLGQEVRYDGGHKRHAFLCDELAQRVEFVPVCPEVELGLGTPRETIRLVSSAPGGVRLEAPGSGRDLTEPMAEYARERVAALRAEGLDGYVLKSKSPSCGLTGVELHQPHGPALPVGRGAFAHALHVAWPELPLAEERDLEDEPGRAKFLERVFAYARLRGQTSEPPL
ncbi:MAG: DUF523 domain-containing protein [Planctomycetes bacterium]|nr:DUF523 domain-containing protein [Planctomycetota bacterium]